LVAVLHHLDVSHLGELVHLVVFVRIVARLEVGGVEEHVDPLACIVVDRACPLALEELEVHKPAIVYVFAAVLEVLALGLLEVLDSILESSVVE